MAESGSVEAGGGVWESGLCQVIFGLLIICINLANIIPMLDMINHNAIISIDDRKFSVYVIICINERLFR